MLPEISPAVLRHPCTIVLSSLGAGDGSQAVQRHRPAGVSAQDGRGRVRQPTPAGSRGADITYTSAE
eukprot:4821894-Pyramimonas_sp.AAC.1